MKTKLVFLALVSAFSLQPSALLAQGSLTPPGAPAPTMKTLTQVEPRTPISSVGGTISSPGSYYLTTNLTITSGNFGVLISSGNVTLDLNGFVLQGVPGSYSGVYVNGTTNVTVRNGAITGCGESGVDAYTAGGSRNLVFEHLTVSANGSYGIETEAGSVVRDCCSMSNHVDGIYCYGGLVSGCVARDNGNAGININDCTVRDCQVESNYVDGILANHSSVRDCQVLGNGYGVYVNYCTVSGCYVAYNLKSGIYVYIQGCQITGNNCYNNNTSLNTSEAGIYIDDNNNRVEDNHVVGNGYAGIMVGSGFHNNIIVKNTVISSSVTNYSIPTGQIVGPLITNAVSGVITNSNPWANFSF
ncbi:MAG: right-handed parallel beta-helix repeat-containing protein [Limisphaerales bacterium]